MTAKRTSRRDFLKTAVAGASAAALPLPAIAQPFVSVPELTE